MKLAKSLSPELNARCRATSLLIPSVEREQGEDFLAYDHLECHPGANFEFKPASVAARKCIRNCCWEQLFCRLYIGHALLPRRPRPMGGEDGTRARAVVTAAGIRCVFTNGQFFKGDVKRV